MINFNITLFIQIGNFVATAIVLERYVYYPLIQRLLKRRQEEKHLRDELFLKKRDIDSFLHEKTSQLSQFQKDAKTDFPFTPVTTPPPVDDVPAPKVKAPTAAELTALQEKLEQEVRS